MHREILLCLLIVLGFNSCKNEQVITFSEVEKTTDTNTIVEINVPEASGNLLISNTINSEIESYICKLLSQNDEASISTLDAQIDAFNRSYKDFTTDFPNSSQQWEAQIDGEVIYKSSEIISIALTAYINTGGAHGSTTISFLNFESATGNLIPNTKLFNTIEAFKNVAQPYFKEATRDKSLLLESKTFELPANIGYSDEGIILLYNVFEIAPYSEGIIEFTIPYSEVNDYLIFNGL
ncbi:DUF4163 domain-containing protein [Algibacter sp. 2305UL17-15]|uniref:DUF3298 and DUF4163 domain-containing protein n=1 Tax=Algibacter sp. 2305UL17-15 TaxID=3231268 RepID=UPI003459A6B2